MGGNEFLFDIVADPRERTNLKERAADVFERPKSDYERWNSGMLNYTSENFRHAINPDDYADRYSRTPASSSAAPPGREGEGQTAWSKPFSCLTASDASIQVAPRWIIPGDHHESKWLAD